MSRLVLLLASVLLCAPVVAGAQEAIDPRQAVARALERNPSLAAAVLARRSAGWAVVGEDALFSPSLQVDASATHNEAIQLSSVGSLLSSVDSVGAGAQIDQRLRIGTDLTLRVEHDTVWNNSEDPLGAVTFGPFYDTSARFELTQPLLRGAGAKVAEAALRQARARETEAERAAATTASQLVRDVVTAWWELWYAEEAVRIQRESLALAIAQRDDARRRVETGTQAPVSVLTFETRVAELEEGVASAEVTRRERALTLAALLGDASTPVSAAEPALAPVQAPDPAQARALAIEASPSVREAEASRALAEVQAETAADPFRPRLDVQGFAEVGTLAPSFLSLGGGTRDDQLAWSAGVNLIFQMPLDGRQLRAAREQARLAVESAQRRVEQAVLDASSQVESQLARLDAAISRVDLAKRTVDVAERQLEAEKKRYAIGTATAIEVLEAEEAVRSARLRLARAEADLRGAAVAVEHLTGTLLAQWVPQELVR